jgi:hypothetical protein
MSSWSTVRERGREEEHAMAKRIGLLRIVAVRPIPPPRVDRYDRIIADEDREMARLAEAQVFGADLIGLAAPGRPRLRHQLRAWYLGRTLPMPVVVLPSGPDGADDRSPETVVLPAFR